MRREGERVGDLERRIDRESFSKISACTIKHKVRQMCRYGMRVNLRFSLFVGDAHVLLTSFVRPSTVPGFEKPKPVRHREKRS